MVVDQFSPIAPARVRALVLPAGRIKRSRFMTFMDRLLPESIVRLGDISPDPRPHRTMFSPLAFPNGMLLYEMSTTLPSASQLSLSPYELFREPFVIIGIADGKEYGFAPTSVPDETSDHVDKADVNQKAENDPEELATIMGRLRDEYPKALVHQLLIFDCSPASVMSFGHEGFTFVPPVESSKTTTVKTIMADLTSVLLAEMTTLAKSYQALPTVASPSISHFTANQSAEAPWRSHSLTESAQGNYQINASSRPQSPAAASHQNNYRMSMPTRLPSSSSAEPSNTVSRPASPNDSGRASPARTFDDIAGLERPSSGSAIDNPSSGSNTIGKIRPRDSSKDRVSVHGFGSGGITERNRNIGKGRVGIVIGTMYLQSGRWQDALRELVDNTTKARAFSDHLWHAKGLENIMICLILLAWAGMDFQIPRICYPIAEKASSIKSPQHTPSSSVTDVTQSNLEQSSVRPAALQTLAALLPDLINMILSVYGRASTYTSEALPQYAFSHCIIRFATLLSAINVAGGTLTDEALRFLVRAVPFAPRIAASIPRPMGSFTKHEITSILFRALPPSDGTSGLSALDTSLILNGIASVLSVLNMQRKKALVVKELLASLIPGLVQARKLGAAAAGLHPAASLAPVKVASGDPSVSGISSELLGFLSLFQEVYGIFDFRAHTKQVLPHEGDNYDELLSARIDHLMRESTLRSFGSLQLKCDILQACINFSEALPDFQGTLHSTALLLKSAGPGTAPPLNGTETVVHLTREEQIRLAGNIARTIGASVRMGLPEAETTYWDEFLIRGISVIETSTPRLLASHRKSELLGIASTPAKQSKGPFLHDAFSKKPERLASETIIVAEDEYEFVVTLQNLYEFDVEIEALKLACDGVDLSSLERNILLGPYRTQKCPIRAVARTSGKSRVSGCFVKVRGCRERFFPIYSDPWAPKEDVKIKSIGLPAVKPTASRPQSDQPLTPQAQQSSSCPTPTTLDMTVVRAQPLLAVAESSIPQSAVMLLEGEKRTFTVTVCNLSSKVISDFLHISFQDSASTAIQNAMSSKDLPRAELSELEWQLVNQPVLRWNRSSEDQSLSIAPGEAVTFEIEILGKPGLTTGTVRFDYACLGIPLADVAGKFYTRQVSVAFSVTVNASVQLQRIDVLPFAGDFAWSNQHRQRTANGTLNDKKRRSRTSSKDADSADDRFKMLLDRVGLGQEDNDHCLFLLDLRNGWPVPLSISLQVRDRSSREDSSEEEWRRAYTSHELIQPGHTSRLILLLPRIYLPNAHDRIPFLNPANERQFVVSATKLPPEAEIASREAFWYRAELLKLIRGSWKEEDGGRHGEIELRSIRMNSRMVRAMKLDELAIDSIIIGTGHEDDQEIVRQTGRSRFEVAINELVTLRTTIHNRSDTPVHALLRLQPSMASLPHYAALDLGRRLLWSGSLQRPLPLLRPDQTVDVELGLCVLCGGEFEVGATVEEIQASDIQSANHAGRKLDADIGSIPDTSVKVASRRIWHAQEPCTITARSG